MMKRLTMRLLCLLCFLPLATGTVAQQTLTQSSITRKLQFLITANSGTNAHVAGLTGALAVVTLSKNGAAYASPAGTVAEVGNGTYALTPTSADDGTLGPLWLHAQAYAIVPASAPTLATAASGGTVAAGTYLVAYTWTSAGGETTISPTASVTTTGTTSTITVTAPTLPTDVSGINVYVSTAGGGSGTLTKAGTSATNLLVLTSVAAGAAVPGTNTATVGDPVDKEFNVEAVNRDSATNFGLSALPTASPATNGGLITVGTGAGQLNPNGSGGLNSLTTVASGTATAGGASQITLAAGSSATTDLYKGNYVLITSGTGAGQSRTITGYAGGTLIATVSRAWTVIPDATSVYAVIGNPHPALDANLAVTAGTVSDKMGYSLTQAFPANFSLFSIDGAGKVTFNNTNIANWGGLQPSQIFPANFSLFAIDASGRTLLQPTQAGVTIPTVTTLTNAPSDTAGTTTLLGRGDAYARIGAAGAGLTALGDARLANLDALVSSRMATFTLPTNFAALALSGGGAVTVGTLPASVVPAGDVTTIANAASAAVLAANVGTGVTVSQAIAASMRNLKSNVGTLNMSAHTRVVTYFVPGTSDGAAAAGTGTALFTATVHYATDNTTIIYTTYN